MENIKYCSMDRAGNTTVTYYMASFVIGIDSTMCNKSDRYTDSCKWGALKDTKVLDIVSEQAPAFILQNLCLPRDTFDAALLFGVATISVSVDRFCGNNETLLIDVLEELTCKHAQSSSTCIQLPPALTVQYTIGPLCRIKEGQVVCEISPFPTTLSYINEFASLLIDKCFDGPPFVLLPPDFDSQNVMVDPVMFDATGFLGWDNMYVGPQEGRYACYPAWITRDWDPLVYNWPLQSSLEEDYNDEEAGKPIPDGDDHVQNNSSCEEPPEVLQAHRDLYHTIYSDVDLISAEATRHSHLYEAILIGISQPALSSQIMLKLTSHIFDNKWTSLGRLLFGMEEGEWLASRCRSGGAPSGTFIIK
ncbi:hypothetical protein F5146DRAFT_1004316 [Armillaria mellea]|nr:hypothetical protein F5146DRAFT_1004316 [Armillaria mellea]